MPIDPARLSQFEGMGVETVRALLLVWTGEPRMEAVAWLAQKDAEERARNDASQAEQMRVALSANRAAWIAAPAAIIAAILAAISIAIAIYALVR